MLREKTNHSQAFFFDVILMRTFFVQFTFLRRFFHKVTSLSISRNLDLKLQIRPARLRPSNGSRTSCWLKFDKSDVDAENAGIYGSQSRGDFDRDDIEQYFNYMGVLAVEGTYSKMEALLSLNIHPVDILLMLAATEGDRPIIEELLRAGANYSVKDADGRTVLDRANNEEIPDFICDVGEYSVMNIAIHSLEYFSLVPRTICWNMIQT